MSARRLSKLAGILADSEVRTVIEVCAPWDGCWYDTTRSVEGNAPVPEQQQNIALIGSAVEYIELRGEALGYVMERQPGQPHLVRFKPLGART